MTEATPLASEQITQEDREAGASFARCIGARDESAVIRAFARHRIAALSASPAPSGQGVSGEVDAPSNPAKAPSSIPEGMKPWHGGICAPEDWAGPYSDTLLRNGVRVKGVYRWTHWSDEQPAGTRGTDIVAYTPKPAPAPSCAPGEVEQEDFDFAQAVIEQLIADKVDVVADDVGHLRDSIATACRDRRLAALSPQGLDAKEGDVPQMQRHVVDQGASEALGEMVYSPASPSQRLDAATVERCAQACEEQARAFLSPQYAIGQPSSSFAERFAAGKCAEAIRSLVASEQSHD